MSKSKKVFVAAISIFLAVVVLGVWAGTALNSRGAAILALGLFSGFAYAKDKQPEKVKISESVKLEATAYNKTYKDMIDIMEENGFGDAANYMKENDYEAMDDFMNNITDKDYDKMIDIMKNNGYEGMAQMMESIGKDEMIEMHNAMGGAEACH